MNVSSGWAVSRMFDLLFFIGPVLIGLLYFAVVSGFPGYALPITVLAWMIFGQGHFASTWFMFADRRNRSYHAEHALVYHVLPACIVFAVFLVGIFHFTLLLVILSVVSLYHVTRQSIGILRLYRAKNGEKDTRDKLIEETTVFAWALTFGGYGALHLPRFSDFGFMVDTAPFAIGAAFGVAVLGSVLIVARSFFRERNSLPKNLFLAVSCMLYLPYVYASPLMERTQNFEIATLVALVPHYMQYIGLVWLINRNKYAPGSVGAAENPFLAWITERWVRVAAIIAVYVALMGYCFWIAPNTPHMLGAYLPIIVIALMILHFYIDAFIWRFSNPFVRETVLPYMRMSGDRSV